MGAKNGTPEQRFWPKINKDGPIHPILGTPCWLWTAGNTRGYGLFRVGDKKTVAHRFAWTLAYGPIPDGLDVLHRCDNPPCCNPTHLWTGTHSENMQDMVRKGRDAPWCRGVTHCIRGHEFVEANIYWWQGERHCRECRLQIQIRRRQKTAA